jgi:uncharacterized protein YegL
MNRRDFLKASAAGLLIPPVLHGSFANALQEEYVHPRLASGSTADVGASIVCLFDVSGSIDKTEYEVQLEAMAKAIGSEDFRNAIFYRGGPQSVALCVVAFSNYTKIEIPWVDIREGTEEKLVIFANEIRDLQRYASGGTNQTNAMKKAKEMVENRPWNTKRSMVDLITDGKDDGGGVREQILSLAYQHDTTVNALITFDNDIRNFEEYANEKLVTPPGIKKSDGMMLDPGFVKIVATQQSAKTPGEIVKYHKAMELAFRRKIVLEVAGLELEELHEIVRAENRPAVNAPGAKI